MRLMHIALSCLLLIAGHTFLAAAEPARDAATVAFAATVDFGADRGRNLGSLFEARDAEGRIVASAGFHDVYNTHFRTDRHTLQVYVRPANETEPVLERLPYPDLGSGVYLLDDGGELYAWTSVGAENVRRWDAGAGQWRSELPAGLASMRAGDGVTQIGAGRLTFSDSAAQFDGRPILQPPGVGAYADFYYANGHLCFYHRRRSETDGFTHVCACPWTPGGGPIDLNKAVVLDTKYDFEATFAWGQFDDQVLTVGNSGGVYVFDGGAWRVVREPDRTVSYQVYSMLRWHDRLLLAQYPSGHVFEYRGEAPQEVPDWPPRLAGVASSARECQTLAIYNGDLFAGVWPWAELWRLDDNATWRSHGRLFTHPAITDEHQHPYETESMQSGVVLNYWGQRISGMVPLGDSLYLATSSKGTAPWPDNVNFLTDEQRQEYGALVRLRMPGNLAAGFRWAAGPTRLVFVAGPDSLSILQDGVELATTPLPGGCSFIGDGLDVTWGKGPHGPLSGQVVEHEVTTAPN